MTAQWKIKRLDIAAPQPKAAEEWNSGEYLALGLGLGLGGRVRVRVRVRVKQRESSCQCQ